MLLYISLCISSFR